MKKQLLFFICLFGLVFTAYSQTQILGVVNDLSTGEALPGVSVSQQGTNIGTITDKDGNFSITADANGTLVFSYLGFETQYVSINGRRNINVSMKVEAKKIDEIVVIGYGVQRKSDLTGAIASVSGKELKNYAVSDVSQLLTGKATGVYVASSSGQPGSNAIVRIRGLGTVNDNNPLYVVDGQPLDNINNISPQDIDRIEVLKDASACAIYGSRGSNGVILITTKKGVAGETSITFDSYIGGKSSYKGYKMCNSEQFYNFVTEAYANAGQTLDPRFKRQYERGYDTNWWNEVSRTGLIQNYNLSIRQGKEDSRTALSLSYLNDEGAIITTKFDRITLRFNNEYDISKAITVGANLGLARTNSIDVESALPSFRVVIQADPFTPVINPLVDPSDPNYEYDKYAPTEYAWEPTPVAVLNQIDRSNIRYNFFGNLFANIKLFKGLSYRFQYSFERNNGVSMAFNPIYHSVFTENNLANMEGKYRDITQLTQNTSTQFNTVIEQRLNYSWKSDLHNFQAMAAATYETQTSENINAYKTTGPGNDKAFRVLSAQTAGAQTSGDKSILAILSYLGRINYAFKDTYLATVNFRTDGSSRFAKGNRRGYFPSFSLGWRISNESFFQNFNKDETLSNLKIRVGWGQNGNQRIDNNAALTLIGTSLVNQWYFGTGFLQGYAPTYMGNSIIKWETSQQMNIGLDATLFNDRLDLTADYYIKNTKDMLLMIPTPSFASYPNDPWSNAGDIKNKGFELNINHHNTIRKFNYSIGVNLSTYKTKVTNLTSDVEYYLTGSVSRTYVGGPLGRFYGHKVIGVFQNQAEIQAYSKDGKLIQPNAKPGDFKFADLNNDGVINNDDRDFIGDPNPKLIYGLNFSFGYGGFDLSWFLQGVWGNDIWNASKNGTPTAENAQARAYTEAWRKEGDPGTYPRITNNDTNNNFRGSNWYVENGSFMRLQNIQLGYNVPKNICLQTKLISACRIYISGQNLLTFTKYSGLDPELGSNNPLNMGFDNTRYPNSRVITAGINLQF